ncbi:MAG TPA: isochorismatase family cysteine hydrolase [Solirubrobacterales bacterium]|nr:isochorismatase family cysteine hydrolase [Solirubrobacterales bacterium]
MPEVLLLLDYQKALCRREGSLGESGLAAETESRQILANAARCLEAARSEAVPVAHVFTAYEPDYRLRTNRSAAFAGYEEGGMMQLGSFDAEICDEVTPADEELVLRKGCVDPFVGTSLMSWLISRKLTTLYVGGIATNFVVESLARTAGDSGFDVRVLEDCCASFSQEMHAFSVENMLPPFAAISSSEEFVSALS